MKKDILDSICFLGGITSFAALLSSVFFLILIIPTKDLHGITQVPAIEKIEPHSAVSLTIRQNGIASFTPEGDLEVRDDNGQIILHITKETLNHLSREKSQVYLHSKNVGKLEEK